MVGLIFDFLQDDPFNAVLLVGDQLALRAKVVVDHSRFVGLAAVLEMLLGIRKKNPIAVGERPTQDARTALLGKALVHLGYRLNLPIGYWAGLPTQRVLESAVLATHNSYLGKKTVVGATFGTRQAPTTVPINNETY